MTRILGILARKERKYGEFRSLCEVIPPARQVGISIGFVSQVEPEETLTQVEDMDMGRVLLKFPTPEVLDDLWKTRSLLPELHIKGQVQVAIFPLF